MAVRVLLQSRDDWRLVLAKMKSGGGNTSRLAS
jgi:hypothetical protein